MLNRGLLLRVAVFLQRAGVDRLVAGVADRAARRPRAPPRLRSRCCDGLGSRHCELVVQRAKLRLNDFAVGPFVFDLMNSAFDANPAGGSAPTQIRRVDDGLPFDALRPVEGVRDRRRLGRRPARPPRRRRRPRPSRSASRRAPRVPTDRPAHRPRFLCPRLRRFMSLLLPSLPTLWPSD